MRMACAPGLTLVAISSRCSCMASLLHGWQNQGGTGTLFRADCAEQIGRLRALVVNVARSRARSGPTIGQLVLLADPHLVLEPHLYRCTRSERAADFRHAGGKVFLNASIASVLCL